MVCFERAVEAAEIGNFRFHDLRHTFATRLRAANVHEYDIADLLGHTTTPFDMRNIKVTRGYVHGVSKRLRDAVDSLEEENSPFWRARQLRAKFRVCFARSQFFLWRLRQRHPMCHALGGNAECSILTA